MVQESLFGAMEILVTWPTAGWLLVGLLAGIIIGTIPGLGPNLGLAVVLPLTMRLNGPDAIILLISIYSGAMYGGSIAAILINTPGTAAAAATTLDGYPMTRQGRAMDALSISATASAVGGAFAIVTLILLTPFLTTIVLMFGSPEYFLIALFGIALITIVAQGSMVKGLTAGAFGLLLSTIGFPVAAGQPRYTFDTFILYDGLDFVAVLIGIFAVGEMIKLAGEKGSLANKDLSLSGNVLSGVRKVVTAPVTTIKSGYIGMFIGAIPGSGASISNFISYAEAVRSGGGDKEYGDGNYRGVIASEASNNGTVAGSLIPTFSFGIPGSGATAILLGGLMMHGLRPGPELFTDNVDITYSIFLALLAGNVVILLFGLLIITRAVYITTIDTDYIIPVVIAVASLGAFGLRGSWLDVFTVLVFGIFGFFMMKHNYSIIAFVLGIVLGPIAEENLVRSLQLSEGSLWIFVNEPIPLVLTLLTVAVIASPILTVVRSAVSGGDR
ncbi:tripartite tricarboxylate transporter permease [Halostagnicola bangensis]